MKKYASVKEAKTSYDDALKDARTLFGDDKDSEPLVRTAAVQVFMKKYASVKEAKTSYDELKTSAYTACINDKKLSDTAAARWAKTIANSVFTNHYITVPDAIRGYLG